MKMKGMCESISSSSHRTQCPQNGQNERSDKEKFRHVNNIDTNMYLLDCNKGHLGIPFWHRITITPPNEFSQV